MEFDSNYKAAYSRAIHSLTVASKTYYKNRLVSLVLFGSVARDAYKPGSDLDLLLVADPLPDGRGARIAEFAVNVEKSIAPELVFSADPVFGTIRLAPIFKTPAEIMRGSLLFLDMTLEAVMLFDKGDFFREYLAGLRERMQDLGSRRVPWAGSYYWDLKPDFKPGDVISL